MKQTRKTSKMTKAGTMSRSNNPAIARPTLRKLAQDAVCILLALTMVFWQTPVYAIADEVEDPQPAPVATQAEKDAEPEAESVEEAEEPVEAAADEPAEAVAEESAEAATEEPEAEPTTNDPEVTSEEEEATTEEMTDPDQVESEMTDPDQVEATTADEDGSTEPLGITIEELMTKPVKEAVDETFAAAETSDEQVNENSNQELAGEQAGESIQSTVEQEGSAKRLNGPRKVVAASPSSADLSEFITNVTINGLTAKDGVYQVEENARYTIVLNFEEQKNGIQFEDDTDTTPLTFYLSEALNSGLLVDAQTGDFRLEIAIGDGEYVYPKAHYNLTKEGLLTVWWDRDDDHFEELTASQRTYFKVAFEGSFSSEAESIPFGDKSLAVTTEKDTSLTIEKGFKTTADNTKFNATESTADYYITVHAGGSVENVVIKDELSSNSLLSTDYSSITVIKGSNWEAPGEGNTLVLDTDYKIVEKGNGGFDIEFLISLEDSDYTVFYTADVDVARVIDDSSRWAVSQKGKESSELYLKEHEGDLTNTATAKSDDKEAGPATASLVDQITRDTITKQVGDYTLTFPETEVPWTITVLSNPALGGSLDATVGDRLIPQDVNTIKYSGEGVYVTVSTRTGSSSGYSAETTELVTWESLGVDASSATDFSFTMNWLRSKLNINEESGNIYKYEFAYDTTVNTSLTSVDDPLTVSNEAFGNESDVELKGVAEIGVYPDYPSLTKEVGDGHNQMTWTITTTVPASGYTSKEKDVYLEDTLPNWSYSYTDWDNGGVDHTYALYDELDIDSITVTGLVNGESYEIDYEYDTDVDGKKVIKSFKVNFFYTDINGKHNGFISAGAKRDVTVTYTTYNNKTALDYADGVATPDSIWNGSKLDFSKHKNTVEMPGAKPDKYEVIGSATLHNMEKHGALQDEQYELVEYRVPDWWLATNPTGECPSGLLQSTVVGTAPLLKYSVVLQGLTADDLNSDGSLTIKDSYESKYLALASGSDYAPSFRGGDAGDIFTESDGVPIIWNGSPAEDISVQDTDGTITFKIADLPKNGGSYYPDYVLTYYLYVKDLDALTAAASQNDHATYYLNNTVSAGEFDDASKTIAYSPEIITKEQTNPKDPSDPARSLHYVLNVNPEGYDLDKNSDTLTFVDEYENISVDFESFKITVDGEEDSGADRQVHWYASGYVITFTVPDGKHIKIEYDATAVLSAGKTSVDVKNVATIFGQVADAGETRTYTTEAQGGGGITWIRVVKYADGDMTERLQGAQFELYDAESEELATEEVFATDNNGAVTIGGTAPTVNLIEGKEYYLKEINAPEGYVRSDSNYYFTIAEDNVPDYGKYIYKNFDTITISNETEYMSIPVRKIWKGGDALESAKFTLKSNGEDTGKTLTLTAANNWEGSFAGLRVRDDSGKKIVYTIEEDDLGDSLWVSDGGKWVDPNVGTNPARADKGIVFTNTKKETISVSATKSWLDSEGKKLSEIPDDVAVTFSLLADGVDTGKSVVLNGEANLDGETTAWTATFSDLLKYQDDNTTEIEYTIKETEGVSGFEVDGNDTVANGGTITNKQKAATGSITFEGTKTLTGREMEAGEFSFQVKEDDEVVATGTNAAKGNTSAITFDAITYDLNDVGTHTYTVSEVVPEKGLPGVAYDDLVYDITVNVSDNNDGTLNVVATGVEDVTELAFTNEYSSEGDVSLSVNKELTGRSLKAGEFNFELKDAGGDVLQTAINDGDGKVAFKPIPYTQDDFAAGETQKTYTYTISEVSGEKGGITYDESVCKVKVELTDDGEGNIAAIATYTDAEGKEFAGFKNAYTATGDIKLSGTKTFQGRELTGDDRFTFNLLEVDKNGEALADGANLEAAVSGDADSEGNLSYSFNDIEYDLDDLGTHYYKVTEANGGQTYDGIAYDETEYTIAVEVTDKGNGKLEAAVTSETAKDALNFTNTYTATGKLELSGTKTLEGRGLKAGDTFNFQVIEGEGDAVAVVSTGTSDETGQITFSDIKYTLAEVGSHTYTVKELSSSIPGVTASTKKYALQVEVSDNGDGTLKVAPVGGGTDPTALDFENTYAATGSITFVGNKSIDTRALTDSDVFTFEIYENGEIIDSVQNDANGTISYPTITYTLDDVGFHTYTVKESSVDSGGVKSAGTEYEVTVEVTDNEDGTLNVVPSENYESLNFVNAYTAKGELVLSGTKTLTGRGLTESDVFTFSVTDNETGEKVSTGTSGEAGKITYVPITYSIVDAGKEFTYTVKENASSIAGVTDSGQTYTLKVKVTDNANGTLEVKTVEGSDRPEVLNFENAYDASGKIVFSGKKTLEGRGLAEGEFKFQLKDSDGNLLREAQNDEEGNYAFDAIEYGLSDAGKTYTYTVSEFIPEDPDKLGGVEYDANPYTIEVAVSDNGDGTLKAEVKSGVSAKDQLDFKNTYDATGDITLSGTKELSGRDFISADTFEFNLVEVDAAGAAVLGGKVLSAVASGEDPAAGADGALAFAFEKIEYSIADLGPHYYKVTEKNGGNVIAGTEYDDAGYTVAVQVSDNGDGTLSVELAEGSDDPTELNFTNTYSAQGSIALKGEKNVRVPEGVADASKSGFGFTLEPVDDAVLNDGTNDVSQLSATSNEDGVFTFPELQFTEADAGKVYAYTISEDEVSDTSEYAKYDAADKTVYVRVTDQYDGTLKVEQVSSADDGAEVVGEADAPSFANAYIGRTSLSVSKVWDDADNVLQQRPDELAVELLANGASLDEGNPVTSLLPADTSTTVVLDEGNGWKQTIADLPVYDLGGAAISYTWDEKDLPIGYALTSNQAGEGDDATLTTLTNTLASVKLSFDKYYYGASADAFDFKLTPVEGNPGETYYVNADGGAQKIDESVTVQNGAFADNKASVEFDLVFTEDGSYTFSVVEAEDSTGTLKTDEALYVVSVEVEDGAVVGSPVYVMYYPDESGAYQSLGEVASPAFYNNDLDASGATMRFRSMSMQGYTDSDERVSVYPEVMKYLNDSTDRLVGGDFTFELRDAHGNLVAAKSNDELGRVAFFDETDSTEAQLGLVFDEPGTYTYAISERVGTESGVTYDSSVITLTVEVTADEATGILSATTTYADESGAVLAEPAFHNQREGMDLRVRKVSREGGEGLAGCTYALWMVGPTGDVMLQESVSDDDGWILFEDAPLMQGQKYYFREVEAPSGHVVDPYRTAYFSLNADGTGTVLVEETAADGWHSRYDAD